MGVRCLDRGAIPMFGIGAIFDRYATTWEAAHWQKY